MKPKLNEIFKKTTRTRTLFFLFSDFILIALSLYLSLFVRFEGEIPSIWVNNFPVYFLIFFVVKVFFLYIFKLYHLTWIYVGFYEIYRLIKALVLSFFSISAIILFLYYLPLFHGFPRSVPIIDFIFSLIFIGGLRISKRFYLQILSNNTAENRKRALIIGAGNAGEQIVRDMLRQKETSYIPVAFVDDDRRKIGTYIHGIKVLGNRREIPKIVDEREVELAVIALPSAEPKKIRSIVRYINKAGVKEIKIIPGTEEILKKGNISLSDIKEISLEDLLGREEVKIDYTSVRDYLHGKRILVTGAGGSIGSEIAKQVCEFQPESLALLDIDETRLFDIERKLKETYSKRIIINSLITDIRDKKKIDFVFSQYIPQIVFHAAAYKHVPMLEFHPDEAVKVNIWGTKILTAASLKYKVEKFVLISTDKAVNPLNVMGATKRVAELIACELNSRDGTKFISVRFGNVLGSRGSVIPIFEEQIEKGGPVRITHEDMERYFMTTTEAVLLVLQAGALDESGEIYVLDMGEPVRIVDLAEELIRLHGLIPHKDIPIIYTGIRPGEKISEELLSSEDGVLPTRYKKIFKVKSINNISITGEELENKIKTLYELAEQRDIPQIIRTLQLLVPTYHPKVDGLFLSSDKNK